LSFAIVSAVMVGGLFLWRALRYGTGYQTVWKIRPSAETPSSVHWRRFYFQLTRVHSALKLSGRCALQIYLLTYFWKSSRMRNPDTDCRHGLQICARFALAEVSLTAFVALQVRWCIAAGICVPSWKVDVCMLQQMRVPGMHVVRCLSAAAG